MKRTLRFSPRPASWGIPAHVDAQRPKTGNPVLPEFHADPEILYAEQTDKYYIYSTTDGTPGWGGYYFTVFSSKDLTDWRHEGIMLDLNTDQVRWSDGNAWAPCIIEKKVDGKYKYYFYYSGNTPDKGKAIGVATADHPCGPFTDSAAPIIDRRPEGQPRGQQIDVDVFEDPVSGKTYLYWGNGYMAGAELQDDMMGIKPETETLMTPARGHAAGLCLPRSTLRVLPQGALRLPLERGRHGLAQLPRGLRHRQVAPRPHRSGQGPGHPHPAPRPGNLWHGTQLRAPDSGKRQVVHRLPPHQ